MANVALNIILGMVDKARPGLESTEQQLRTLRAESKAASEDMKAQWGEAASMAQQLGASMTIAGGAIVGGMVAASKSAADYGSELWDMHTRTGASVESLSALKYAAEQTGTSLEGVSTGLKFLAKNSYEARDGNNEQAEAFRQLGVELRNTDGTFKNTETLFIEVGQALRGVTDENERTALAMQLFSRSGQQLLPMFLDTKGGIETLMAEAKSLGLVMSGEASKAADEFGDSLHRLNVQSKMAFVELGVAAMPVLQQLAGYLSGALSLLKDFVAEHPTLAKGAVFAAGALGLLLTTLGPLLMLLPGIVQGVSLLRGAFAAETLAALGSRLATLEAGLAARASGLYATIASGGFGALATSMGASAAAALPFLAVVAVIVTSILALIGGIRLMVKLFDDVKNGRWGEALKDVGKGMLLPTEALEGAKQIGEWIKGAKQQLGAELGPGAFGGQGAGATAGEALTPEQMAAQVKVADAQAAAAAASVAPLAPVAPGGLAPLAPTQAAAAGGTVTVNMPITINGATDPQATGRAVGAEITRRLRVMMDKTRVVPAS